MALFGRVNPGEFALLRLAPGIVVRAKAHTAAVKLKVSCYEN